MKIKNIFIGMLMIAAVMLSACSSKQDTEAAARDAELQQELIGVWCYLDSVEYDSDENMVSFEAYEFTDQVVKAHEVSPSQIASGVIYKYAIKNGEFAAETDGKEEYAKIEIREVDGKDYLLWITDEQTEKFFRMTDEEIECYHIPAGELLMGEAELLGIETTASE
ncbi:MAG: hypothetical protein ACI4SF_11580 [Oscillospiraceae bacterium]